MIYIIIAGMAGIIFGAVIGLISGFNRAKQEDIKKDKEIYLHRVDISHLPQKFIIIKCKYKKYVTSGCYGCWYCEKCGRRGCDNLYYLKPDDKVITEVCDKEGC